MKSPDAPEISESFPKSTFKGGSTPSCCPSVAEAFLWHIRAVLLHLLQPGGVDSFPVQDLLAVPEGLWGQGGRAGEDPGVFQVEGVEEVHAGVDHGVVGVVCGQDPVRHGGGD